MKNLNISYNAETGEFYVSLHGERIVSTILTPNTSHGEIMTQLNGYVAPRRIREGATIIRSDGLTDAQDLELRSKVYTGFAAARDAHRTKVSHLEGSARLGDGS